MRLGTCCPSCIRLQGILGDVRLSFWSLPNCESKLGQKQTQFVRRPDEVEKIQICGDMDLSFLYTELYLKHKTDVISEQRKYNLKE